MAFSLHIGTKWCHDFPKLARESGFYFEKHKSRTRINWNCISSIDIDRIIRERDFYTIDDNITNVIDYCLESEYDVKILDPNFVKLFRLAQLAVEYLLYCKQYLDHSVIILKDELRLKIEENVKLKNEITTFEETIKRLKEKAKERNRLIETKIGDCSGEIYKCPHCPKTFISSMFVSAHVIRRHACASDLCTSVSPIHEHYRNETEKLHDEIKNLKERLNETEKVIRNETEKVSDRKTAEYDKGHPEQQVESFKRNVNISEDYQEYKGYQEEIKNLKTMLFDEIHNLRQKEKTMYEHKAETNVQTLINRQEMEFQKLKNQLFEKLNPDIENMHAKLYAQENYWKSKIEQLENQHLSDVERLAAELKSTQKIADDTKAEYESKVNDLERQVANQSKILTEQSKRLHSLSNEISISQLVEKSNGFEKQPRLDMKTQKIIVGNIDSIINSDPQSKEVLLALENKLPKSMHTLKSRTRMVMCGSKRTVEQEGPETANDIKFNHENKGNDISELKDLIVETENGYEMKRKKQDSNAESFRRFDLNESNIRKLKGSFNGNIPRDSLSRVKSQKLETLADDASSETNSELSVSDLHTPSETESITTIRNNYPLHKRTTHTSVSLKPKKIIGSDSFYKKLEINLKDIFEQKLRDLGIDPEWQGIPTATFEQKMNILKHHEKIATKKLPKYHRIKLEIIKEVLGKISKNEKVAETLKCFKGSPSHKSTTTVKSAALNDKRTHGNTPVPKNTSNNVHSTLESDASVRSETDNESSVIFMKVATTKATKKVVEIIPNSVKATGNVQRATNSQESSVPQGPFSKTKSLFGSEQFNANDKDMLNNKPLKSNNTGNLNIEQDLSKNISISPKHNKSVLKSATGSTSSLTKKKVIFDLGNEEDKESLSDYDVDEKGLLSDRDTKKEELNVSNWNIDERKHLLTEREVNKHSDNIILKTTQSNKIAEISRKLEAQLNMVRQKPVGSVETIFSSTYKQDIENEKKDNENINRTSESSLPEGSFQTSSPKLTDKLLLSLHHNVKDEVSETLCTESVSDISDLDSDIDKILKLG